MNLEEISILNLIPQRPPFVMVDRIVSFDGNEAMTAFEIRNDSILVDGDYLSAAGIIENMAQSCAARMGLVDFLNNVPIKIGYIGDIKNCDIHYFPKVGDIISSKVRIVEEVFNLRQVDIESSVSGKTIAKTKMKLAISEETTI